MSYRPQAAGECEKRISDSVAPKHLSRRQAAEFNEVPARHRRQGPGECEKRISGHAAPEHLRGPCRQSFMKLRQRAWSPR